MEAMLADGNVMEKLMELKAKDNSLFMKMKQFFDNLLSKIRNVYKGLTPDSDEGKAVLEMTDSIEKIQQLFAEALVDASENFQSEKTQKNTTNEGSVSMSIREIVGESGTNYGKGVYLDSNKLTNIPEAQRKAVVIGLFRQLGGKKVVAYDPNGTAIEISIADSSRRFKNSKGKSIPVNNHITSFLNNTVKQGALILADEVIAASHFEGKEDAIHTHDWLDDDGKNQWDVWKVFLQEKNKSVWEATLKVANTTDGEKILYELYPIEKVEAAWKPGTSTTNNRVTQPEPEVKKNSDRDTDNTKFSMRESVEETKDLLAYHNITAKLLADVLNRNGLLMPSLAVTNKGMTDFGEISLLFDKSTIDPSANSENKLYGADAWTPTQTQLKKNAKFDTDRTVRAVNTMKNRILHRTQRNS